MTLPTPPQVRTSQFRLDAITLRGIGPYFHEARLDIKPLTILAGTNGSGKSTWMKMLRFLQNAADHPKFPLEIPEDLFPVISGTPTVLNETAMLYICESQSAWNKDQVIDDVNSILTKHDPEFEYGPLGTIGLESTVLHNFEYGPAAEQTDSLDIGLRGNDESFNSFALERGDRIAIQITFESGHIEPDKGGPDRVSRMTLIRNGRVCLEIREAETVFTSDAFSDVNVSQQKILLPGLSLMRKEGSKTSSHDEVMDQGATLLLAERLLNFVRFLIFQMVNTASVIYSNRELLDEPALRPKHTSELKRYEYQNKNDEIYAIFSDILADWKVGEQGERALLLERAVAETDIYQAGPFSRDVERKLFREKLDKYLAREPDADVREDILKRSLRDFDDVVEHGDLPRDREGEVSHEPFVRVAVDYSREGWIRYGATQYFEYWVEKLLDGETSLSGDFAEEPCGFLVQRDNAHPENQWANDYIRHAGRRDYNRFVQGALLKSPSPARTKSTGFHHVAPMVVQTEVMFSGETVLIESPEAHLHPSLQVSLTEFFILHAKTGRQFILETHSDLLIRRTVRALLEEGLSQEDVRMYFVRVDDALASPFLSGVSIKDSFSSAYLERIEVNNKGQIANWPSGFMDVDIAESRRLMDAIYGNIGEDEFLDDD